jgi:hypothetical protein
MANSFKQLLPEDVATTRTLLHEAIPITGTIVSGTYDDDNIKTFSHGMFESVYDYPYLSSSANHIFDITAGYSPSSELSASTNSQNDKKMNIYNQMAQVLVGYDVSGNIQQFDSDGNTSTSGDKMQECFFINFSRLLTKDEIKKNSFRLDLYATSSNVNDEANREDLETVGDYDAQNNYLTNSPAGDYGLLYTSSVSPKGDIIGHVYYQAGIAVITASYFTGAFGDPAGPGAGNSAASARQINDQLTGSTITELANGWRYALDNIQFNNTTELNSTIYFCRANNTEYNYSSNPTYLSESEIRVKGNNPMADPVSYITTVGLYSPDNELLAVAKLSEPLKKAPSNEITLRCRLDY